MTPRRPTTVNDFDLFRVTDLLLYLKNNARQPKSTLIIHRACGKTENAAFSRKRRKSRKDGPQNSIRTQYGSLTTTPHTKKKKKKNTWFRFLSNFKDMMF